MEVDNGELDEKKCLHQCFNELLSFLSEPHYDDNMKQMLTSCQVNKLYRLSLPHEFCLSLFASMYE